MRRGDLKEPLSQDWVLLLGNRFPGALVGGGRGRRSFEIENINADIEGEAGGSLMDKRQVG